MLIGKHGEILNHVLILPFPLKVAQKQSMSRSMRSARRLGFARSTWFKSQQNRYKSVALAKADSMWYLLYEHNGGHVYAGNMSGGFATKQDAINWFVRGGR